MKLVGYMRSFAGELGAGARHLHALAGLTLSLAWMMLGTLMPVEQGGMQPAGVWNEHGVCYLAATIEIFDAFRAALPKKEADAIFSASSDFISAYMRAEGTEVRRRDKDGVYHIINPKPLVDVWVAHNQEIYPQQTIFKKIHEIDGSKKIVELVPCQQSTGKGGFSGYTVNALIAEIKTVCCDKEIANPFEGRWSDKKEQIRPGDIVPLDGLHYGTYGHWQTPEERAVVEQKSDVIFDLDSNKVLIQGTVVEGPRFLWLFHHTMKSYDKVQTDRCRVPLQFTAQGHLYKLLGALYVTPIITEQFEGGHVFAVIRMNNTWYRCDNHKVTAFEDEAAYCAWADETFATEYLGPGLPKSAERLIWPCIALYELIET